MSSYIIVESNVLNSDKLKQYSALAAATLAQYGGEFIVKGQSMALHGQSQFKNRAVIRFENEDSANRWYYSDEYQALAALRCQAIDSQFYLMKSL